MESCKLAFMWAPLFHPAELQLEWNIYFCRVSTISNTNSSSIYCPSALAKKMIGKIFSTRKLKSEMNFRCFTLMSTYHSALSGLCKKIISFSLLLLAFFFHYTTTVIELKIIWGTLDSFWKVCKNTGKVPGWASACGLTLRMLFWKSIIAQSDTASLKQWVRHVIKCVSLVELSVYVKLSLLAGLAIFTSPSFFYHQPCNSNSISLIVLSQLRDSRSCGRGKESWWVPVTHLMLSYVAVGRGYCRWWERSVC